MANRSPASSQNRVKCDFRHSQMFGQEGKLNHGFVTDVGASGNGF
jgi:hypothetical protein